MKMKYNMMRKLLRMILVTTVVILSLSGCGQTAEVDIAIVEGTESTEETDESYFFRELPEPVYIEAAESFFGGSGTEDDPYLISTIEEMALLSNLMEEEENYNEYSHAYYELVADITLNEGVASQWRDTPPQYSWKTIGIDHFTRFEGYFNGNGHTISGIYINVDEPESAEHYFGLFGIVKDGIIENINIDNSYICLSGYTSGLGAVAGDVYDTTVSNCNVNAYIEFYDAECGGVAGENKGTVLDCTFSGEIRGLKEVSFSEVGGIVGNNFEGIVENCVNSGSVYVKSEAMEGVGGIVGTTRGGKISNCQNSGIISGADCIGGVIGTIRSSNIGAATLAGANSECVVTNCNNIGKVVADGVAAGIVGKVWSEGGKSIYISDCTNSGIVEAKGMTAGVVGDVTSNGEGIYIERCSNRSDLSAEKAGGVIGQVTGYTGAFSIKDCQNEGNIVATENYSGGVLGQYWTYFDVEAQIEIANCINTGKIESVSDAGGIVGVLTGHATSFSEDACILVKECVNCGEVVTSSMANVAIGGIIGIYGVRGGATEILDCVNSGKLVVTETESSISSQEDVHFKWARICGGIVGRIGETAYIYTGLDDAKSENIGTEDAIIVLNGCSSDGVFAVPDEDECYENQIGGIVGNCSAEDEYTVNVVNCKYSNAERGLGAKYLPDVGTCISSY